ncbi:MAG: hypothetical protein ACD_36C00069G0002 [uncultured bacterium]|nr:MAG: hypothetical protein ACD_36C00069G0002 [uncultured bacterium]
MNTTKRYLYRVLKILTKPSAEKIMRGNKRKKLLVACGASRVSAATAIVTTAHPRRSG